MLVITEEPVFRAGPARRSFDQKTDHEFGRQMLGIGRAAAVSEKKDLVAGIERRHDDIHHLRDFANFVQENLFVWLLSLKIVTIISSISSITATFRACPSSDFADKGLEP